MPLPPLPKKRGTILTDMTAGEPIPEPTVEVKEEAVVEKPVKKAPAKRASRTKKTETIAKTHDAITDLAPCPPTTTAKHSTLGSHRRSKGKKLFVLDTNVLMHDPSSIFRFEEHDIFLPMVTLEELDGHKKGMSDVARNARQVSRSIDQLLGHSMNQIDEGIPLNALGQAFL